MTVKTGPNDAVWHRLGPRYFFLIYFFVFYYILTNNFTNSHQGSTKANAGPRRPTQVNAGQRRPTAPNDGQRRPTQAHSTQRRPTQVNEGPQHPTTANEGRNRPTAAHGRPTQAHSTQQRPTQVNEGPQHPTTANEGQRRSTQAHSSLTTTTPPSSLANGPTSITTTITRARDASRALFSSFYSPPSPSLGPETCLGPSVSFHFILFYTSQGPRCVSGPCFFCFCSLYFTRA